MSARPPLPGPPRHADLLATWDMLAGVGEAARQAPAPRSGPRVGLTVVTGFLGSGKTTLLQHVLEDPGERRIAVLINDFGAISIDAALIRSRTPETIELTNGCACCSLSAGLAKTLAELLDRARPPDAIVLEASGIADPSGILHVALSHPGTACNGVVAVADAEALEDQLDDPWSNPIVVRQLTSADIVLLNKVDLVEVSAARRSCQRIRALTPSAPILETVRARAPAEVLFGLDFSSRQRSAATPHHHDFVTWTWQSEHPLDGRRLATIAGDLPAGVIRAKGFVTTTADPARRYLLQVVGRRWELTPEGPLEAGASVASQIVFIGRPGPGEAEALAARLDGCEALAGL